ncbi:MAG TPA: methyltransferase [Bryobacteraceae bacterium]|nr:methyltransferase [Bryobacteraceae bacterium]
MLAPLSCDDAQRLRDFFREANFTYEHFKRDPALPEYPRRPGYHLQALLERTSDSTTTNMLVRWFYLGVTQERDSVAHLLPEPTLSIMLKAGMMNQDGSRLIPAVMLTPWRDKLFAADMVARMHSEHSADVVLWPNPTTLLLQHFSIHKPSRDTLDLGTGCGVHAILAAEYSERVCATDLNPRAEQFVAFNAQLNNVNKVEYLFGDTFEPVKGRTFDSILANPPFFVTPTSTKLFCENEMELDEYCRRVVREAAEHLNEGGYFQAVMEWVQVRGQKWQERLEEWLDGTHCDAWIVRGYDRDAAGYAQMRIGETRSPEEAACKFQQWMAYYRERGVEEIHGGLFAMRRRSGRNWLRIEEATAGDKEPFGDSILELFATQDILATHPRDDELLGMKPCLSPQARLEQKSRVEGGKWIPTSLVLQLTGGVPAKQAVERGVAEFLGQCDGSKTLEELAQGLGTQVNASPEEVRQQCCAVVRRLAQQRFLQIFR